MRRSVSVHSHPLVFGVVVFLASESMLFAGLLAGWYDLRGSSAEWPPSGIQANASAALVGTILLALGSVTMGVGQYAARRKQRNVARGVLAVTVAIALLFAVLTLQDWAAENFAVSTNAYGTLYYVLIGTHLAHVIVGAFLLTGLAVFLQKPAFEANQQAGVEAIAYYWHFVFVIWLAVWATVYLVR